MIWTTGRRAGRMSLVSVPGRDCQLELTRSLAKPARLDGDARCVDTGESPTQLRRIAYRCDADARVIYPQRDGDDRAGPNKTARGLVPARAGSRDEREGGKGVVSL